jgi:hypothetical protein
MKTHQQPAQSHVGIGIMQNGEKIIHKEASSFETA